jgi:hypothetical protein
MNNPQKYIYKSVPGNRQRLNSGKTIRKVILISYTKGFRVIFIIGAALAVLTFLVALFLMTQVELVRPDDAQLQEDGKAQDRELRERKNRRLRAVPPAGNTCA